MQTEILLVRPDNIFDSNDPVQCVFNKALGLMCCSGRLQCSSM